MYSVVVAKYTEEIYKWISVFDNVVIYDKSDDPVPGAIHIPNVGREAETYVRYIIDNYDTLPSCVVFLQGNPVDHITNKYSPLEQEILKSSSDIRPFFTNKVQEKYNKFPGLCIKEYYEQLFEGECPCEVCYAQGAQYIIPKSCIICRPKEFYIKLVEMIRSYTGSGNHVYKEYNPCTINAWTLERLWPYIFDPKINLNKTFLG